QLFRLRLVQIREAKERRQRVGDARFKLGTDDGAHGVQVGRVADAHRVAHLDTLRIGEVLADDDLITAHKQVAQRDAHRVDGGDVAGRWESLRIYQQHVDKLR